LPLTRSYDADAENTIYVIKHAELSSIPLAPDLSRQYGFYFELPREVRVASIYPENWKPRYHPERCVLELPPISPGESVNWTIAAVLEAPVCDATPLVVMFWVKHYETWEWTFGNWQVRFAVQPYDNAVELGPLFAPNYEQSVLAGRGVVQYLRLTNHIVVGVSIRPAKVQGVDMFVVNVNPIKSGKVERDRGRPEDVY
jgi:hypothetical protein